LAVFVREGVSKEAISPQSGLGYEPRETVCSQLRAKAFQDGERFLVRLEL
jgi:hypothetical protein